MGTPNLVVYMNKLLIKLTHLFQIKISNIELAIWVVLFALAFFAYFFILTISRLISSRRSGCKKNLNDKKRFKFLSLIAPILFLATLISLNLTQRFFLRSEDREPFELVIALGYSVFFVWGGFVYVAHVFASFRENLIGKSRTNLLTSLFFLEKIVKFLIFALSALFLLHNWGFNIKGLLAAVGVGGIALAFAGQKTFESIFGGVMLLLDQPVKVGDLARFGTLLGTVEDIGLRSIKIRTAERVLVAIPNSEAVKLPIENYTERDKILFEKIFQLSFDMKLEQVAIFKQELYDLLYNDGRIEQSTLKVYLKDVSYNSWDFEVSAYALTANLNQFLPIRQDLLTKIYQLIAEGGFKFAVPTQLTLSEYTANE